MEDQNRAAQGWEYPLSSDSWLCLYSASVISGPDWMKLWLSMAMTADSMWQSTKNNRVRGNFIDYLDQPWLFIEKKCWNWEKFSDFVNSLS